MEGLLPFLLPLLPKELEVQEMDNNTSIGLVVAEKMTKGEQLGPYEGKVHKEKMDGRFKVIIIFFHHSIILVLIG